MVTATDENGCSASDEVVVGVSFSKDIFVPNAFTPNGDGKNDIFKMYGHGVVEVSFRIHDRWGTLVFESKDPSAGWDGVYNGEQLSSGVYYYSLVTTYVDGDERKKTGDVTLIR